MDKVEAAVRHCYSTWGESYYYFDDASAKAPYPPVHRDIIRRELQAHGEGGLAIVEARNELFALLTLNRYSSDLFETRLVPKVELEKEIGVDTTRKILNGMRARFRMDLPPMRKGKEDEPGYDEVLSRTHNPFEIREQFAKAGFRNVRTLFYHFHVPPPMLKQEAPEAFDKLSIAMEKHPSDWRGNFMALAFLITGIAE